MAKVHRIALPAPFWSLEFLELDVTEQRDGCATPVKRLYLVDRSSPRGLRLLKSRPSVPTTLGFRNGIAEEIEVVE